MKAEAAKLMKQYDWSRINALEERNMLRKVEALNDAQDRLNNGEKVVWYARPYPQKPETLDRSVMLHNYGTDNWDKILDERGVSWGYGYEIVAARYVREDEE